MKNKIIYYTATSLIFLTINLFLQAAFGQVPVVNTNTIIKIESASTLFIDGSLTEQATATIDNSGFINLTGDFINNATNNCFGTSAGTVSLTGASQNLGGTSITAFNNLVLSGTGTKSLLNNIIVGGANGINSGILDLGARNLSLSKNTLTISNKISTAITRTTGFIESETDGNSGYGIIQWNIGNGVPGSNYEFPFGNAVSNSYIPYDFKIATSGIVSGTGSISVATYPTITNVIPNNRSLPIGVTNLNNALNTDNSSKVLDRFWIIDATGYSTNPIANMTMTYRDNEHDASGGSSNVISESQLQAQQWDGSKWNAPTGSVNTSTNTVTVTSVSSFATVWALASSLSPLPIELLSFDAKLNKDKKVDLTWATASEINNDYFTMERSANGTDFENIGIVDGAGNSTTPLFYKGLDSNPYYGISYYRLKQTDFDGHFTYSNVVPIELTNNITASVNVNIYPNPAGDYAFIQLQNTNDFILDAKVAVFNAVGQLVLKNELEELSTTGSNVFELNTERFQSGFYMVRIMNGEEVLGSQKLIIK